LCEAVIIILRICAIPDRGGPSRARLKNSESLKQLLESPKIKEKIIIGELK
jgi:hypothetical protein